MSTNLKDILWIEDFDDYDSLAADLDSELSSMSDDVPDNTVDKILGVFGNEHSNSVRLIQNFLEAIEEIKNNRWQYTLIVFDINLNKGLEGQRGEALIKMKELLGESDIESDNFEETAGIYLLKYLQKIGYPRSRMAFLTGNGIGHIKDQLKSYNLPQCMVYEKNNIDYFQRWVDVHHISNPSEYLRIRSFVFEACNHWVDVLQGMKEDKEIPFNDLYSLNIERASFISMLERLLMLFTIEPLTTNEVVYYQAMQILSMYHEESAKIGNVKNRKRIFKYHSLIRTFRNWAAHNKFEKKELTASTFELLFCIALRTYFHKQKHEIKPKQYEYYFEDNLFDYESKASFLSSGSSYVPDKETIQQMWQTEILLKLKLFDDRKDRLIDSLYVSETICRLGEQSEKERTEKELLFILFNEFVQGTEKDKFKCTMANSLITETDAKNTYKVSFGYEIEFKYADEKTITSNMNTCDQSFLQAAITIIFPS